MSGDDERPTDGSGAAETESDDPVPVGDWAAVERGLRGFDATVEPGEDRVALRAGRAEFAVTRDGTVESEMPLHAFAADGVEALSFDHEAGRIRLSADGVDYEFRVP